MSPTQVRGAAADCILKSGKNPVCLRNSPSSSFPHHPVRLALSNIDPHQIPHRGGGSKKALSGCNPRSPSLHLPSTAQVCVHTYAAELHHVSLPSLNGRIPTPTASERPPVLWRLDTIIHDYLPTSSRPLNLVLFQTPDWLPNFTLPSITSSCFYEQHVEPNAALIARVWPSDKMLAKLVNEVNSSKPTSIYDVCSCAPFFFFALTRRDPPIRTWP